MELTSEQILEILEKQNMQLAMAQYSLQQMVVENHQIINHLKTVIKDGVVDESGASEEVAD